MPARLIWRPQARDDLLQIYEFIGLDNPAAAERLYETIRMKVTRLGFHPRIGPRRHDIRPGARVQLVEGDYIILYRTYPDTDEGPLEIVESNRIVHGRRDLKGRL